MLGQLWRDIVWLWMGYKLLFQLLAIARRNGVRIEWSVSPSRYDGLFYPLRGECPTIMVFVGQYRDIVDVCITIAHELGHFDSRQSGLQTPEVDSGYKKLHLDQPMNSLEKQEVLLEEAIAWDYARQIFDQVGNARFSSRLLERQLACGRIYRQKLLVRDEE